jgi:hypothetical protein
MVSSDDFVFFLALLLRPEKLPHEFVRPPVKAGGTVNPFHLSKIAVAYRLSVSSMVEVGAVMAEEQLHCPPASVGCLWSFPTLRANRIKTNRLTSRTA